MSLATVLRPTSTTPSRGTRKRQPASDTHLPSPPDESEKYSYFGLHRRWPFVWLFLSQAVLIYAFIAVMTHNSTTALGLILLSFMVPPVLVNLWLRMRRHRVTLEGHITMIEDWRRATPVLPSVDVFVPCCGEDEVVLNNTFAHISQLDWPGQLRVHVLDDADDEATRWLAGHWGFEYVVRPNRGEWKKAGNLIHAFDHTDGEFIAVFDADFAPRPDFLYETVPYMQNPKTGVVQTAQYFDVDDRVNEFARFAGSLQELFFRWIQPSRDTCEAAICAGTNVVYRRKAVEAAGGFAKVPLGEDVHSGVKIWVANYRTRYVPLVLAKGLAPDTWNALTNQQYRWCRSSMLLMASTFFRDAPFGLKQRICFWSAFLYYMSSAAMVLTSVLPTTIMLWFYPEELTATHYIAVAPALISTWFIFPMLARGWKPAMFRVAMINTMCHLLAVFDALRNQVAAWVPTGAAGAPVKKKIGVPLRIAFIFRAWFVLSQLAVWSGVVRYVQSGHELLMIWPLVALWGLQAYFLLPIAIRLKPTPRLRDVYGSAVENHGVAGQPVGSLA